MRRVSYSKFSEEDLGIERTICCAASDYLLRSGYQDPYMQLFRDETSTRWKS